jgi:hypothetical protein
MAAQTITPIALGTLLLADNINFGFLPVYASICLGISILIFSFVKNIKTSKTDMKKGLEGIGADD